MPILTLFGEVHCGYKDEEVSSIIPAGILPSAGQLAGTWSETWAGKMTWSDF